jgi:hypothetical protein
MRRTIGQLVTRGRRPAGQAGDESVAGPLWVPQRLGLIPSRAISSSCLW